MVVLLVPSLCFGETAVEIIPGVTHYGGHSTSVEIIPGHTQYYGAYEGTVTEITPGVSSYNLRARDTYRPRHEPPLSLPYPVTPREAMPNPYQSPDWLTP